MSRPYIKVEGLSYNQATNIATARVKALRIRDRRARVNISFNGVTGKSIQLTNGWFDGTVTFSVNLATSTASDGFGDNTSPGGSEPTATFTVIGEAQAGDSVDITLGGGFGSVLGGGYTFTQSVPAGGIVAELQGAFVPPEAGFTSSTSGTTLTLTAPWGDYYNGLDAIVSTTASAITFSATFSEFSGGLHRPWTGALVSTPIPNNDFSDLAPQIALSVSAFTASAEGV